MEITAQKDKTFSDPYIVMSYTEGLCVPRIPCVCKTVYVNITPKLW